MPDLKSMTYKISLACTVVAIGLGSPALWASDVHSARSSGLGGAGHAGPLLTDSLYLNPSYVSFLPNMAVSSAVGVAPANGAGFGSNFNISIQDGHSSSLFQAGFGYTHRTDTNLFTIGAAKSFVKRVGLGVGGKFVVPSDPSRQQFLDTMISSTGLLWDWLQVALVVDNVVESPAARAMGFYREFILGTKVNVMGIFLLYADPHWAPSLPGEEALGIETGIEFPIFKDFFLRGGYFRNSNVPFMASRGQGFGVGLGWLGPRLSVDYGFERVLTPGSGLLHNVSLSVFF